MHTPGTVQLKVTPAGFTPEQMREFWSRGFLTIENAISDDDVSRYLQALDRVVEGRALTERDRRIYAPSLNETPSGTTSSSKECFLHIEGLVGLDAVLEELIDHERHIGFVYDIFGELTKLHISEAFLRPDDSGRNPWHVDGPRMVPFSAFAKDLPLQIRVGYWLTDVPQSSMGNLVVIPGSHRLPYFAGADTDDSHPAEEVVTLKKGAITIMHGSLWHRVGRNTSRACRKNIYLGYCPSWIMPAERIERGDEWVATLPRERRIILRRYQHPYDYSKPPVADSPLYLTRPYDPYPWRFSYPDALSFHRRKQPTLLERFLESEGAHVATN